MSHEFFKWISLLVDCLNKMAPLIAAIATIVIAYFSYKSNAISQEMKKISSEMKEISNKSFELNKSISEQNDIQRNKSNKLFWAIVFSNLIAADESGRKNRFGFIIKLFGWQEIQSQTEIEVDDLKAAINSKCQKYVDQLITK